MKKQIEKLINKTNLTEEEMIEAMNEVMNGEASEVELASFLTALRMKGETIAEITGGARVMREKASSIKINHNYAVDTCGTGGDSHNTYNISTTVSFILAAGGVPVVKHGNRAVSSKSGSADVLEALGINLGLNPSQVGKCVDEIGIGFLFAPTFHGAMKHAIGVRRALGFRTVFNMLGPLTNPAEAKGQILGVFNKDLTEVFASVLKNLGTERALVVHGFDGMDEISISDKTQISELKDGEIKTYTIEPEDFGISKASIKEIKGGDAKENAEILKGLLKGEILGAKRDILLLNAGASLYVGKKAQSIKEGIELAKEIIDNGKAYKKLEELIRLSNEVGN